MLFWMHGMVVARRGGRGLARLFGYLYEGCTTGDPVAILITVVIAAVIVGWIASKFSGGASEETVEADETDDDSE